MAFSNNAQPTKTNLRTRVSAVIEASHSGHMVGKNWQTRNKKAKRDFCRAMRNAEAWAFEARRALENA